MIRRALPMHRRSHRRGRARRRSGFTLIEVMVSLGVMTIGAMAIIALQTQTIRSNARAREIETATQIAQLWIERFKQDARTWTDVAYLNQAPKPNDAAVLANTQYLSAIVANPGIFQAIPWVASANNVLSPGYDYRGNPVPNTTTDHTFCASFRPAWVWYGRSMRVDVRVWWAREGSGKTLTEAEFLPFCNDDNASLNPGGAHYADFHQVYLPTVIRVTPLRH